MKDDKAERLNRWKNRVPKTEADEAQTKETKNKVNNDVVHRIGKIGKSMSRISQEDVREAIRSLKSPTPEREWSTKDMFRDASVAVKGCKMISHELNDEGFEETQSLVSDTPSHGKDSTSSCNEDRKNKRDKPLRMTSTDSAITTASEASRSVI